MNAITSYKKIMTRILGYINYPDDKEKFVDDSLKIICGNYTLEILENMPEEKLEELVKITKEEKTENLIKILPQFIDSQENEDIFNKNLSNNVTDFVKSLSEKATQSQKIQLQLFLEEYFSIFSNP